MAVGYDEQYTQILVKQTNELADELRKAAKILEAETDPEFRLRQAPMLGVLQKASKSGAKIIMQP